MNKKYKVSPEYIRLFLGLLHEGIDSKLEDLSGLNLVNRDSVKRLVKEYLYPEYQNFTISTQFRIKEGLRFGLNFGQKNDYIINFLVLTQPLKYLNK